MSAPRIPRPAVPWLTAGAVAGGAAAAAATVATSVLAAYVARMVVLPERRVRETVEILEVVADATGVPHAVVLRADAETTGPGRYDLWFDGDAGHARIGAVTARDEAAGTVTREILGVDRGDLAATTRGRWSGCYFPGPGSLGLRWREETVTSDAGVLPTWHFPAGDAAGDRDAPAWAILVHGRGAARSECLRGVRACHEAGLAVLVPALRNDPEGPVVSAGRSGLGDTEWRDVAAAVDWAVARGARRIVLFGWSMGGATVLQAVSRSAAVAERTAALVLDGPVLDWYRVLDHERRARRLPVPVMRLAQEMLTGRWAHALTGLDAPVDLARLDWTGRADQLRHPMLVLHSADDQTVPVSGSRSLAHARPDLVRYEEFTAARHTREWNVDPARWEGAVGAFLGRVLGAGARGAR